MYGFTRRTVLPFFYQQVRSRRKLANPGIEKRLKIAETNDAEYFEDDDDLNYEFDVDNKTNPTLTRKQEIYKQRERLKMLITRQKYFNINFPNFLTWQEKEQIRYLHHSDPKEWSIDKLSDTFPALPDTIKKILSSQWKPKSDQRIINHDKHVSENWKTLQNNQIDLDENLKNHLSKFMRRKNVDTILESTTRSPVCYDHKSSSLKTKTEFLDIIKSNKPSTASFETKQMLANVAVPFLKVPKMVTNKNITLECLKKVTGQQNLSTQNEKEISSNLPNDLKNVESKFSELTVNISSNDCFQPHEGYSEVIQIPTKYWVKGKTYRVADCYYDDDGEFLYRVPGMVKSN